MIYSLECNQFFKQNWLAHDLMVPTALSLVIVLVQSTTDT